VTTDRIFRISEQLAKILGEVRGKKLRVKPLIFTSRTFPDGGISQEQLDALLDPKIVTVRETVMQIPSADDITGWVTFFEMWKLIHGQDSKPPELPRSIS
jgi:hypothetical protein